MSYEDEFLDRPTEEEIDNEFNAVLNHADELGQMEREEEI